MLALLPTTIAAWLVAAALGPALLASARPSPSSPAVSSNDLFSLVRRQQASAPAPCVFVCTSVSNALSSCGNSTCLCNNGVLDSFVDCSECTLQATEPANLNASIASYQVTIDAFRSSCSTSGITLPNVTVSAPAANVTYPTGPANATNSSSSSLGPSASSSAASSSFSVALSSSSAAASSSSAAASAGASQSASASSAAPPTSQSTAPNSAGTMTSARLSTVLGALGALALACAL